MSNAKENYISFISKYLNPQENANAILWILAYAIYAHAIDDIIDEEIPKDSVKDEFILKTFEFAETVYTNIYYLTHISKLRPLVKMASNSYMDAVQMEKSNEKWKRDYADVLRTLGNEVLLAVIEIEKGLNVRRTASLDLRELSYKTHHTQFGQPI